MYRIKNTTEDRSKHLLHRTATQFELEPQIGGKRIRLRSHLDIEDEHYQRIKPMVDAWERKGIVEVTKLGVSKVQEEVPIFDENGLRLDGPTLEKWVEAGYQADNYPPKGYAEIFSPGLVAYKQEREEAASRAIAEQVTPEVIEESPAAASDPVNVIQDNTVPAPLPVVADTTPLITQPAPTTFPPPPPTTPAQKAKKLR